MKGPRCWVSYWARDPFHWTKDSLHWPEEGLRCGGVYALPLSWPPYRAVGLNSEKVVTSGGDTYHLFQLVLKELLKSLINDCRNLSMVEQGHIVGNEFGIVYFLKALHDGIVVIPDPVVVADCRLLIRPLIPCGCYSEDEPEVPSRVGEI